MNTFNRVEKTAYRVTIKNKGRDLYTQSFTNNDGNCRVATNSVKTQVWEYSGTLGLAVESSARKISLLLFSTILCGCLSANFRQLLLKCQLNKFAQSSKNMDFGLFSGKTSF